MKFLRYLFEDQIKPAIFHDQMTYDISHLIEDIDVNTVGELTKLSRMKSEEIKTLPVLSKGIHENNILPCIKNPRKIVAIGMNYIDHLERINFLGGSHVPPEHFIFFQKPSSSIIGPYEPIFIPRNCNKLDYENEMGLIIAKTAKYIDKAEAHQYIAGFCITNDVSERSLQFQSPGQYEMGKSSDSFCPIGPFIVTPDEVNLENLSIQTKVNNTMMQDGNTKSMIFTISYLLAELSKYFTLQPGDIILTGTPKGVQLEEEILGNTPRYLQEGDIIELAIEGLGYQRNVIRRD